MEYLSSSFNGMCPEEADFMSQLLGNFSLPNEVSNFAVSSALWPPNEPNVNVNVNALGFDESAGNNAYSFSQGSSYSGSCSILVPACYPCLYNNSSISMDHSMNVDGEIQVQGSHECFISCNVMEGGDFLNQDASNGSMESDDRRRTEGKKIHLENVAGAQVPEQSKEEKINCCLSEGHRKRPRNPAQFQRSKRSMKLKSCTDVDDGNDNNIDSNYVKGVLHRQNSCCSEDDSNFSNEMSGTKRASRGSATDTQSLYARKRRERINERLKILQHLVPNGTKVDISTMLEEAVQYVKFLQVQIKLLSSDELWMYAPIAYNGMDIGLDLKLPTPKSQS